MSFPAQPDVLGHISRRLEHAKLRELVSQLTNAGPKTIEAEREKLRSPQQPSRLQQVSGLVSNLLKKYQFGNNESRDSNRQI